MNFRTIGGFVTRNGKSILKKTALAAGVIAGLAFLTDRPEDGEDVFEGDLAEATMADYIEGEVESTAVEVTEEVN